MTAGVRLESLTYDGPAYPDGGRGPFGVGLITTRVESPR